MTNYTYYPLLAFKPYMLQNTQIETHSSIFEKKKMNKPKLIYSLTLVMTITIRHFVSTVADYGLDSK